MGIVEIAFGIPVGGASVTAVSMAYVYRFRIRRILRARLYGHKHDLTRNKKFVAHDRDRHNHRVEAEERWMKEWVALLGSEAPISDYQRHLIRLEAISSNHQAQLKRKQFQREAENNRIAEIILEKRLRDRRKIEVLADAAKQQRVAIARMAKEQLRDRNPWS